VELLVLAFAPGVSLCLYVYYRDAYERENPFTVARVYALGMAAVAPAILIETWLVPAAGHSSDAGTVPLALSIFLVIAPVEELAKFLVVRGGVYRSREFNEPMDGLVYSTAAAMGFASVENLLYLIRYGTDAAPVRALLAVPGHLFFSGLWGYHLGLAKFSPRPGGRVAAALVMSILLHGGYDFLVASQVGLALLAVPLMMFMAAGFLREIDSALERSPMRSEASPASEAIDRMVGCPGCGAPTTAGVELCQHCGLVLPPEGCDESGREREREQG
jgi:RsiW-degrading membrane proteinase PrsW (M82 family)